MDDFIEIRQTAAKGYGVFAKKAIPSYTVILQEAPIILTKDTPTDSAKIDADIEEAFSKLSTKDQEKVLQLHEGLNPNAKSKVTRIFHTNAFGGEGTQRIYVTKSRFNHSCVPNASAYEDEGSSYTKTTKPIAIDEEITISYLPPFEEAMTAGPRGMFLRLRYHFECRCAACWPPHESWKSDVRRRLIGFISCALKGQHAPDFSPPNILLAFSGGLWPPRSTRSCSVLTPAQEVEYSFPLGKLRDAEGLPGYSVAEGYIQAAERLACHQAQYEQDPATKDIVFLEAARCIEAWYKKGMKLEEKYYSPGHQQIRDGKTAWEMSVSKIPCLQYLRLTTRMEARGEYISSKDGEDFAVLVNEADNIMTSLSQLETADLIRQRSRPRRG